MKSMFFNVVDFGIHRARLGSVGERDVGEGTSCHNRRATVGGAWLIVRIITALPLILFLMNASIGAERPNFVWIVSEDNSIHYLQHWFDGGASTPHIESLAAHGLTFDHAFSNAPVCSVARTTLITGCFAPRIGTQFHRHYRLAEMPEGLRMFPAYLRAAGYFASNNHKKDYNAVEGIGVWDESSKTASWRNRSDIKQPFFHMQSHAESHEGRLHYRRMERIRPTADVNDVRLAAYHPDTKLFRHAHATYLDRIKAIDDIVASTVAQLAADDLLEDTFVFYFGDHGGVLPRSKGYVYESGLHIPLVVRVPEKFAHLVDFPMRARVQGFVSFIDFAPTVLHLAGLPVPPAMDGQPFLGPQVTAASVEQRDSAFGYADRFDEKYDLVRSLRKGKYQYIRNYQPYLPDGLQNNYRYKSLAYQEWRELSQRGLLTGASRQFFAARPVEQLFDCEADPHQVINLASDAKYAPLLRELRDRLSRQLKDMPDLSFYPESYLVAHAMENPVEFGRSRQGEIERMVDTANLVLQPFDLAETAIRDALSSEDTWLRYWAVTNCTIWGEDARVLDAEVRPLLADASLEVRIRAAEFLGRIGVIDPQPVLADIVNSADDAVTVTQALNSIVWFRDFFNDRYPVNPSDLHPVVEGADIDDRLDYLRGEAS